MAKGFKTQDGQFHPTGSRGGNKAPKVGNGSSMSRTRRRKTEYYPSEGMVHEGSLTEEGYNLHEGSEARESALNKAAKRYGYAKTVEKVNALHVVNKGNPEAHHKTGEDLSYLKIHRDALGAKS